MYMLEIRTMVIYLMGRRLKGIFWSRENLLYHDYHVGYADMYICQNLLNYVFKISICYYM